MTDLATVAANLRSIEDMALRLEDRAIDRSNSRDMPGGDALVNLGGTTPRRWAAHVDEREQAWLDDPDLDDADMPNWSEFEDPDELWPAVQILAWWSEEYRQRLDMKYEGWRPTLVSEAKFLRNHDVAEWIWNNEVHWDDYAGDVSKAKTKLENILIEGDRSDRTAVVCDRCEAKKALIRVWGMEPDDDRWKCPGCKHLFTDDELDDARGTQMRRTEPRAWVPRTHAIGILCSFGHQQRVAARLTDTPEAQGWRDETSQVRWVSWPDVWRSHLMEMQAAKIRLENATKAKLHKEACEKNHPDDCWIDSRGCSKVCPRGSACEWFLCPVHEPGRRRRTRMSA